MKRHNLLHILAGFALLAAACTKNDGGAALPTRAVGVTPVESGTLAETVEAVGELEGGREVRVFAQMPERIQHIAVKEGDAVKKGDLLVVLRGDLQAEALNQAEAALEMARANQRTVEDNLGRTRTLFEAGAASKSQLDALEAQAQAAEAQVRQASAAIGQASGQSSRMSVRSPIDGRVSHIALQQGDMAPPSMPLMTIVSADRLRAVFKVAERHFLKLRTGMPVEVQALAAPEIVLRGEISALSPSIDRMTRTGRVEIHLANAEAALMPGSAVRAVILLNRREDLILVPAEAVIFNTQTERTGRADAYVAEDDIAVRRAVVVGARQADKLEIKEGLRLGERLIVQGAHLLRDNNPIKVVSTTQSE